MEEEEQTPTADTEEEQTAADILNEKIAALPSARKIAKMSDEEKTELSEKMDALYAEIEEADEDTLAQLNLEKFQEAMDALTGEAMPTADTQTPDITWKSVEAAKIADGYDANAEIGEIWPAFAFQFKSPDGNVQDWTENKNVTLDMSTDYTVTQTGGTGYKLWDGDSVVVYLYSYNDARDYYEVYPFSSYVISFFETTVTEWNELTYSITCDSGIDMSNGKIEIYPSSSQTNSYDRLIQFTPKKNGSGYEDASISLVKHYEDADVTNSYFYKLTGVNGAKITATKDSDTHVTLHIEKDAKHTCEKITGVTDAKPLPLSADSDTTVTAGSYFLDDTLTASGNITINGNVNLCLNGNELKMGNYGITVSEDATLTICDCGAEMSNGTVSYDGKTVKDYTYQSGGGKIIGEKTNNVNLHLIQVFGKLVLNSGILECTNGSYVVDDSKEVVIKGGSIKGNDTYFGAIMLSPLKKLTITGGYMESSGMYTIDLSLGLKSGNASISNAVIKNTGDYSYNAAAVHIEEAPVKMENCIVDGNNNAAVATTDSQYGDLFTITLKDCTLVSKASNVGKKNDAVVKISEYAEEGSQLTLDGTNNMYGKVHIMKGNDNCSIKLGNTFAGGQTNNNNKYKITLGKNVFEEGKTVIGGVTKDKLKLFDCINVITIKIKEDFEICELEDCTLLLKNGTDGKYDICLHKHSHDTDTEYAVESGKISGATDIYHRCTICTSLKDDGGLSVPASDEISDNGALQKVATVTPKTDLTFKVNGDNWDFATVTDGTITPTIKKVQDDGTETTYAPSDETWKNQVGTYQALYAENAYIEFTIVPDTLKINLPETSKRYTVALKNHEDGTAKAGESVTVTVTPKEHYKITAVKANGTVVTPNGNDYTFTMPNTDVTLTVECEVSAKIAFDVWDKSSPTGDTVKAEVKVTSANKNDGVAVKWITQGTEEKCELSGMKENETYVLEFSKEGFKTQTISFTAKETAEGTVTVELPEDDEIWSEANNAVWMHPATYDLKFVINGVAGDMKVDKTSATGYTFSNEQEAVKEGNSYVLKELSYGKEYTLTLNTPPSGYCFNTQEDGTAKTTYTFSFAMDGTLMFEGEKVEGVAEINLPQTEVSFHMVDKDGKAVETNDTFYSSSFSLDATNTVKGLMVGTTYQFSIRTGNLKKTVNGLTYVCPFNGKPMEYVSFKLDNTGKVIINEGVDKTKVTADGTKVNVIYLDGLIIDKYARGHSGEEKIAIQSGPDNYGRYIGTDNATYLRVKALETVDIDGTGKRKVCYHYMNKALVSDADKDGVWESEETSKTTICFLPTAYTEDKSEPTEFMVVSYDESANVYTDAEMNYYISDKDGDGYPESDTNNDKIFEGSRIDPDTGESENTYLIIDKDRDGIYEDVLVDSNGDGIYKDIAEDRKEEEDSTPYIPDVDGDRKPEPDENRDGIFEGTKNNYNYVPDPKEPNKPYVDSDKDGIYTKPNTSGKEDTNSENKFIPVKGEDGKIEMVPVTPNGDGTYTGTKNNITYIPDKDGDGFFEPDKNGDGIFEGTNKENGDNNYILDPTNKDNVLVDSDGDGIYTKPDASGKEDENGTKYLPVDKNGDGKNDGVLVDSNKDGIYKEPNANGTENDDGTAYIPDKDGDSKPEPDANGDGIFEGSKGDSNYIPNPDDKDNPYVDSDKDGIYTKPGTDGKEDANGDKFIPVDKNGTLEIRPVTPNPDGTYTDKEDNITYIPDKDGDGKPEPDKNGDGIYEGTKDEDKDEKSDNNYILKPNPDGKNDILVDDNGDGIYKEPNTDGTENDDSTAYIPDKDGDSKPEPDANGDGIFEGSKGDSNYIPDPDDKDNPYVDSDKDGIYTKPGTDGKEDANGDKFIPVDKDGTTVITPVTPNPDGTYKDNGGNTYLPDKDGDGKVEPDTNGDGIYEGSNGGSNYIPDPENPDKPLVDGNKDGIFTKPDANGGEKDNNSNTTYIPDVDGDGKPEPDKDKDGIFEGTNKENGDNNYLPNPEEPDKPYVDSDGDGIYGKPDKDGKEDKDSDDKFIPVDKEDGTTVITPVKPNGDGTYTDDKTGNTYLPDKDGDGKPELDTDKDGIYEGTNKENGDNNYLPNPAEPDKPYVDSNGDGIYTKPGTDGKEDVNGDKFIPVDKDGTTVITPVEPQPDGTYKDKDGNTYLPDQDKDGKVEPDANGDGIYEGSGSNNTYIPDPDEPDKPLVDDNNDGIFTKPDENGGEKDNNNNTTYIPDKDGDGKPETDKDGDGIYEGSKGDSNYIPDPDDKDNPYVDSDKDGIFSKPDEKGEEKEDNKVVPGEKDENGKLDVKPVEPQPDGTYKGNDGDTYLPDQDKDGKPETDKDGDGIFEGSGSNNTYIPDQNGDGKPEVDSNGDGLFGQPDEKGEEKEDGNKYLPTDKEDNGKKDDILVDSNGDGIFTEPGKDGNESTDKDKDYYVPAEKDDNGKIDGANKVDKEDSVFKDNDSGIEYIPDQDGDGLPEPDKDGDGIFEGTSSGNKYNPDGSKWHPSNGSSTGSSSKPKKYGISINAGKGGTVTANSKTVKKGETITLTVTPDKGNELQSLTVLDREGSRVELKDNGNGTYSFTMPRSSVTVTAKFSGENTTAVSVSDVEAKDAVVLTINDRFAQVFGNAVVNDVAPIIRNERTMLPIRFIVENLGGTVAWDEAQQKVTIVKEETTIEIFIGQSIAYVNGEWITLDSPAFIENGRTYLPLRFVAENLNATVLWKADTQQVYIVPNEKLNEK